MNSVESGSFERMLETHKPNTCKNDAIVAVITIAFITTLVTGIIGTLVYTGVLHVGLSGIGAMTMSTGLYTLLAGFGAAFILTILVTIVSCLNRTKRTSRGDDEKTAYQTTKTTTTKAVDRKVV